MERFNPLFDNNWKKSSTKQELLSNDSFEKGFNGVRKCDFCGGNMLNVILRNKPLIKGYYCIKDRVTIPLEIK